MPANIHPLQSRNPVITIEKVVLLEGELLASPALCLEATRCDLEDDFSVIRPDLGIHVYSKSIPGLVKELHTLIPVLWDEYATAPDETLASDALQIKANLLKLFHKSSRSTISADLRTQS